jgi:hypothetical protein
MHSAISRRITFRCTYGLKKFGEHICKQKLHLKRLSIASTRKATFQHALNIFFHHDISLKLPPREEDAFLSLVSESIREFSRLLASWHMVPRGLPLREKCECILKSLKLTCTIYTVDISSHNLKLHGVGLVDVTKLL